MNARKAETMNSFIRFSSRIRFGLFLHSSQNLVSKFIFSLLQVQIQSFLHTRKKPALNTLRLYKFFFAAAALKIA
jgi:hypothetical protein